VSELLLSRHAEAPQLLRSGTPNEGQRNVAVVREHHKKAGGPVMVDVLMYLAFGISVVACLWLIDRALKSEED
jgi:hypothetical protein